MPVDHSTFIFIILRTYALFVQSLRTHCIRTFRTYISYVHFVRMQCIFIGAWAFWGLCGNMEEATGQCQTLNDLESIERRYILNDYERGLLFERRCDIIERLLRWGRENEEQGLVSSLSDNWTPEEREQFLADWQDDRWLWQHLQKQQEKKGEEGKEEDESSTVLVEWLNQQSTIDWINRCQEEMVSPESDDGEDELTKWVNALDNALEQPNDGMYHDEQDVQSDLNDQMPETMQVGRGEKEPTNKKRAPRLTIVEKTTHALVLLESDKSMRKSSRPPAPNTLSASPIHLTN